MKEGGREGTFGDFLGQAAGDVSSIVGAGGVRKWPARRAVLKQALNAPGVSSSTTTGDSSFGSGALQSERGCERTSVARDAGSRGRSRTRRPRREFARVSFGGTRGRSRDTGVRRWRTWWTRPSLRDRSRSLRRRSRMRSWTRSWTPGTPRGRPLDHGRHLAPEPHLPRRRAAGRQPHRGRQPAGMGAEHHRPRRGHPARGVRPRALPPRVVPVALHPPRPRVQHAVGHRADSEVHVRLRPLLATRDARAREFHRRARFDSFESTDDSKSFPLRRLRLSTRAF